MFFTNFLPNILGLVVCYYSISFLKLFFRNIVSPIFFSKRKDIRNFGKWVIITGATDGIGKAFAEILAKDGYNLVLISRTEEKLINVRDEILAKSNVEIKLITADFTKTDIYNSIAKGIEGLSVGLLINNVGMSYEFPSYVTDDNVTIDLASDMINCNCLSAVNVTKLVLKAGMLKNGGYIVNISSTIAVLPSPFLAIYGASKSFINSFSLAMQSELKNTKVTVQNVMPLVVSTKMSRTRASLMTPSAKSYANGVLNRLGTCASTHGCLIHELQGWFMKRIPQPILENMIHYALLNVRKRAVQKMAKTQ